MFPHVRLARKCLTGPPGAGKSTTARSLVAACSGPAGHLHSDDFSHFIRKGAIPAYLPEAHKQNEVVIAVIAEAADGYGKGNYFVVVDGIVGPVMNGFEAARRIKHEFPSILILMVSQFNSAPFAREAIAAGASGYVVKSNATAELIPMLRKTMFRVAID